MNAKPKKYQLCDVHKPRGRYPKQQCYACFRVSIDAHRTRILKKLFPETFKEDHNAK